MIPRADAITVKAMDLNNKDIRLKATGWVARVLQHEIDHLDGILFVDRIEDKSTLRRPDREPEEVEPAGVGGRGAAKR